jgi:DNA-binding transcriptional MocR family regulator
VTSWLPDIAGRAGPRYQAIADAILEAVGAGTLAPGDRLPPQRDLAWKLGVTVGTVSRAYMLAEQKGALSGEVGRGTYVRGPGFEGARDGRITLAPTSDVPFDLGINMFCGPAHAVALAEALATIAGRDGLQNLARYMPLGGHPEHRAAAASWIARRGIDVPPERIVVTCGAQHALAVAASALTEAGDTILVEGLTYTGVIDTATFVGRRVAGVAMDEQGMLPDALDHAARASGARVVVVVPTIHNPTTAVMGAARRRALAETARARDLLIVEDDVYGFLPEDNPAPIATLAPERTVYLTSASKSLAAGLRVGWAVAPAEIAPRLASAVFASTVAQPALSHEIIRLWIENGTAERLVATLRAEMKARQALATEVLAGFELRSQPVSFHALLMLPEHWPAASFAASALAGGVRVTPAAMFATDRAHAPNAVRISVAAAADRAALAEALGVLAALLRGGRAPTRAVV